MNRITEVSVPEETQGHTPKFKGWIAFGCGKHSRNAMGGQTYKLDCLDCERQPMFAWFEGDVPAAAPTMLEALKAISQLDASNTAEGFNEWGEAQCFRDAQQIAKDAIASATGGTR